MVVVQETVTEAVERLRASFARHGEKFVKNCLLRRTEPEGLTPSDFRANIIAELEQQGYREVRTDIEHVVSGFGEVYSGTDFALEFGKPGDDLYAAVYAKPPKHW